MTEGNNRRIGESLCKPRAESNLFELCRGAAKLHEGVARIIDESLNCKQTIKRFNDLTI